jgi:hypothetical protein
MEDSRIPAHKKQQELMKVLRQYRCARTFVFSACPPRAPRQMVCAD